MKREGDCEREGQPALLDANSKQASAADTLDFVVVAAALAGVFRRAHSPTVAGVSHINRSVHIVQRDLCSPTAQFTAQVVSHPAMIVRV
jgi:hypothetical protein